MRTIMGQIEPEHWELFALEFGKIAEYDFVYTLIILKYWPISTKLGQNVEPNIQSYLPLNLEKLLNMTLLTLYHL